MDRAEAIERLERWKETALGYIENFERTFPTKRSSWREDEEMFGMAIAALREQEQSKWISVKERLPEYGEVIAISPRYQDYLIGHLITCQEGTGVICVGDGVELEYVTHWMPLPEPPKEGADHE